MVNVTPLGAVFEFPLTPQTAQQTVQDLASNHTHKVRFSTHAKHRMRQRGVTISQVFSVLCSRHSSFTEMPCQTPKGNWKFNLTGFAASDRLDVVIDLRKIETSPEAYIVTVFFP